MLSAYLPCKRELIKERDQPDDSYANRHFTLKLPGDIASTSYESLELAQQVQTWTDEPTNGTGKWTMRKGKCFYPYTHYCWIQ